MAQHRQHDERAVQVKTVVGGVLAAGALMFVAPTGAALAAVGDGGAGCIHHPVLHAIAHFEHVVHAILHPKAKPMVKG